MSRSSAAFLLSMAMLALLSLSSARLSPEVIDAQQNAYLEATQDVDLLPSKSLVTLGVTSALFSLAKMKINDWELEDQQEAEAEDKSSILPSNTVKFDEKVVDDQDQSIPNEIDFIHLSDELKKGSAQTTGDEINDDKKYTSLKHFQDSDIPDGATSENSCAPGKDSGENSSAVNQIQSDDHAVNFSSTLQTRPILQTFAREVVKDAANRISLGAVVLKLLPHVISTMISHFLVENIVDLRELGYSMKQVVGWVRQGLRDSSTIAKWMAGAPNAPSWLVYGMKHFKEIETGTQGVIQGKTVMSNDQIVGTLINSGLSFVWKSLLWLVGAVRSSELKMSLHEMLISAVQGGESYVVEQFVIPNNALAKPYRSLRKPLSKLVRTVEWSLVNFISDMLKIQPKVTRQIPFQLGASATVDVAVDVFEKFQDKIYDAFLDGHSESSFQLTELPGN